jgi:hypothetical protein
MKTSFFAVLHIDSSNDSIAVLLVGGRVLAAMTTNQATFPGLDPTLDVFGNAYDILETSLNTKDGSTNLKFKIEKQSKIVYNYLRDYCNYVNFIAKGDKAIVLLSGFDFNNDANEHPVPQKAVIKRIENGKLEHSAKIYIFTDKDADRYNVEMTTNPADPNSITLVINSGPSSSLEINSLTRGVEVFFRITAGNTHGWGPHSDFVGFIPQ